MSDRGIWGNSEKSPLDKETVENFARLMADGIFRSLQVEILDFEDCKENSARERSLGEAYRGRNGTFRDPESRNEDYEASRDRFHPLVQPGFPILGSLDYPDAPPSTPFLPELEKSRQSFSRKLKGGLAKEFSPSPPPPTPREAQKDGHFEAKVELMEQLMRSLTTGESGKISQFADGVSLDILKLVQKEVEERCSMEMMAEEMVQAILKCSIEEARNVEI